MSRLLLLLLPAIAGCATVSTHPTVMTCPTLPTKQFSARPDPLPPVSATPMTMAPGHWDWMDGNYVWTQPEWVPRSSPKPLWLDGFWTPNGGACVWNPGHFVS